MRVGRGIGRPGQDLRPRPQGPAGAQGRLSQGGLRRRADAAAAAHPEVGFQSHLHRAVAELRLRELQAAAKGGDTVDLDALKAAGLVGRHIERVRVFASGKLEGAVTVRGLELTKGARAAIEAAGGRIED